MMNLQDTSYTTNENHLHRNIIKIMRRIRETTPKNDVNINHAKDSEICNTRLNGAPSKRVIIYLRSSGCASVINYNKGKTILKAGCLDCVHSLSGTTFGIPIPPESYLKQFASSFNQYDFSSYPMICVYNEGNFFNENELPILARNSILKKIADECNIKSVILESLPRFISENILKQTKEILQNKHVEIGVGLESSNPIIRKLCINKLYSLDSFKKATSLINKYFNTLTYVLIKPSFLTEAEALDDTIRSAEYAFQNGAKVVSLEPVGISDFSMSGALSKCGLYHPVWLWTVIEAVRSLHEKGEIRIGGIQFSPKYDITAYNCKKCSFIVKDAIQRYNMTADINCFKNIDCNCRNKWKEELESKQSSLIQRISTAVDRLSRIYTN